MTDYDQVIALSGGDAATHYNRANALQELRQYDDAVAGYDRAIALDENLAAAHVNRGDALVKLARHVDAMAAYERALLLAPGQAEACKGILSIAIANPSLCADIEPYIAQSCAATAAREADALAERKTIPAFRIQHDAEQSAYLLARGHDHFRQAHDALKAIQARGARDGAFQLTDKEMETISRGRATVLRHDAGSVRDCLNPDNDWRALEEQYLSGTPEVVVIDDLLTPPALRALQQFCLSSTVWRMEYDNHYLGAFIESGFLNPILLRIAEQFHENMPRVFSPHALEQLWAFKYDAEMGRGINVHADFARVNLNFWITPDEANLNPDSGGLVIYDVPAPKSWSFREYNADAKRIYEFLDAAKAGKRVVPYRCNRAVLFNSNLFHETDAIHFKEGYENRRINITYLFGRGLSDS